MSTSRRCLWNVAVLFLALVAISAAATTKAPIDLKCPVCGASFKASVIMSTNNFGGYDRDFLEYAAGWQPVLISPITCSTCLYSGFAGDFEEAPKELPLLKKAILEDKLLRPAKAISPSTGSDDIEASVKYDLIAQKEILLNAESETIGNIYLQASWAARLSSYPLRTLDKEQKEKLDKWMRKMGDKYSKKVKGNDNRADMEIRLARLYEPMLAKEKGEDRLFAALAAMAIYRSHGENADALRLVDSMGTMMPEGESRRLRENLESTIRMERYYQRKAISFYEKMGDVPDRCKNERLVYLRAELYRRVEESQKAIEIFRSLKDLCKDNAYLVDWASEQIKICGSLKP